MNRQPESVRSRDTEVDPAALARVTELRRRLIAQRLAGGAVHPEGTAPASGTAEGTAAPPQDPGAPAPLSSAQRRMWFLEQLNPGGVDYLVPLVLRLRGRLDERALRDALTGLGARHEILRTRYVLRDGEPEQVIDPPAPMALSIVDTDEAGLAELLAREGNRGFDLGTGPVWRATLARLGDEEHVLALHLHHIACDGWSADLICADLGKLYAGDDLGAPGPRFVDHARWEQRHLAGEAARQRLRWWQSTLDGLAPLDLPGDRPRVAPRDPSGARVAFAVPAPTTAALLDLARTHRTTPFTVLLAAFAALLARQTRQADIAIGSPVSGRTRAETETVVGPFLNTLVLRCDCSGDPSFATLLDRAKETVLGALSHQDVPFDRIVDALQPDRDLSRNALVSTLFLLEEAVRLEDTVSGAPGLGGLEVSEEVVPPEAVKVDLSLGLRLDAGGGLLGALDYATALFDRSTVEDLAERYVRLLDAVTADPGAPLSRIDLLGDDERSWLLDKWNATDAPVTEASLHDLVLRQAERTPDAQAVVDGEVTWSYRELVQRSTDLARRLADAGVSRGDVVGVCLHRGADLVCTLLAVIRAGGAYLPLDPEDPPQRRDSLAADASARLVVDADWLARPHDGGCALPAVAPHDLAYVIYTSGSTGRPKGVMIDHAGIVNRLEWMQRRYGLDPGDRVLQKTPYTFDVSVWEFFWPLLTGATLVVAPPGAHRDPYRLDAVIRAHGITHLHFVPSMLDAYLDAVPACPPTLRHVFCSGEALRPTTARAFAQRCGAALHNLYGPTEASVDVTAYRVDPREPTIPIGQPIDNIRCYVLDSELNPAPIGVPGELYLGGIGLARGYLGRPDLTAQRFVPDPHRAGQRLYRTGDLARWRRDGNLDYLGRIDTQVKLHGVRIEPGEIEARLAEHPRVASAAAVVHRSGDGPARLVAYVVPRRDARVDPEQLRTHLAGLLPATMVPGRYVTLTELPLTSSGKVDRAALPEPDPIQQEARDHIAPSSPVEQAIADVWGDVLGVARVGATDDFFALGGDSMRAIRAVGTLRERGIEVSVQDLFQHRTVAGVAGASKAPEERLDDLTAPPFSQISDADRALLPDGVTDAYPLSQVQAGMLYELMTDEARRPYHNVTVYTVDDGKPFAAAALREAVRQVVARHEVLRTSCDLGRYSEPLQLVHATARIAVAVEDLEGLAAGTQEELIKEAAQAERTRLFELTEPGLFRLRAWRTGTASWVLAMVECHVILDGWSHNSLLGEVLDRYQAVRDGVEPKPLTSPARRFADFVAMERRAIESEPSRDFWSRTLGTHETLRLPGGWGGDPPGPAVTVVEPIGDLVRPLRDLAATAGVPVKSVFLAAFAKVMSALTPQTRFLCGLVSNGRPEVRGGDEVFGMYLNTVPLPVDRPRSTWRDLLRAASAAETSLWPHRRYPLPSLQSLGGSAESLVEAVFNFLDFYLLDDSGVDLSQTEDDSPNEFPLQLTVVPGQLIFTAQPERVRPAKLTWLARAHRRVLVEMLSDLDGDATGSVLGAQESADLSAVAAPPPVPLPHATLHDLIEEQSRRTPEAVAVCDSTGQLTYAELSACTDRLARALSALGAGPGRPVAVLMQRSLDLVPALVGILKAGAAFVPLDHNDPPARQAARVESSGAVAVLADDPDLPHLNRHVITPRDTGPGIGETDPEPAIPADAAYIMFTSGSTGGPKGVMVPHAGIANYLQWLRTEFPLGPGDRIVQKTPYTFDVSVSEFFWPLMCGATVVMAPPGAHRDPVALAACIGEQRVTHACFVPSMLDAFLELADEVPACVREVFAAGEALRRTTVERFRAKSAARLHNMYGPTEASIIASAYVVPATADARPEVPMGRAIGNMRTYVLDPDLNPVPSGVDGELYLAGIGLAHGYTGQPALTAAQFLPDPTGAPGSRMYRTGDLVRWVDGDVLEFAGRVDHQIKISGVRIEPAEVEQVLLSHPAVRAAVVVPHGPRLAGYLVPRPQARIDADELRTFARDRLPGLLVPAHFVILDDLPLTGSGKVDRRALPAPAVEKADQAAHVPPRNAAEEAIAAVWQRELRRDAVSVEADFADLGGHSLAAMRIAIRLRQEHGHQVSPTDILTHRTVAALASALAPAQERPNVLSVLDSAPGANLVWFRQAGSTSPLYCVHPGGGSAHWYQHLTGHLPDHLPVAGIQHPGLVDPDQAGLSTEELARRYTAELLAAQPTGPYRIFGWCGGGPIAWEMAILLRRNGSEVTTILLDPLLQVPEATVGGGENLRLLTECDDAYQRLAAATAPEEVASLKAGISRLLPMIITEHHHDILDDPGLDDIWPAAVRSWRQQIEARLPYRYQPYGGAVHLLACDELAGGIHEGLAGLSYSGYVRMWQRLAGGGADVHRVHGGNITSMLPPHVTGLARSVADILGTGRGR